MGLDLLVLCRPWSLHKKAVAAVLEHPPAQHKSYKSQNNQTDDIQILGYLKKI